MYQLISTSETLKIYTVENAIFFMIILYISI